MAGQGLERREVLRILAIAGAASGFPGFARWTFACGHGTPGLLQVRPAAYTPRFFSADEYATLVRLTEIIVPSDDTPGAPCPQANVQRANPGKLLAAAAMAMIRRTSRRSSP